MKDLKYITAYIVPLSTLPVLTLHGGWSWFTVGLVFVLLPLLELVLPQSTLNIPPEEEAGRSGNPFFDILLYLNIPIVYAVTACYLYVVLTHPLSLLEWLGSTLSVGIVLGANGINVAHELGHRSEKIHQFLSKILLLPCLSLDFFIEHNRGHHKNVATPLDPATARFGEVVYTFWFRSIIGSWKNAWILEMDRLRRLNKAVWSLDNEMLRFIAVQAGYLVLVGTLAGFPGVWCALSVALTSRLLLESINYIEHYGLQRKIAANGKYEPVSPGHSWNSNHELGRIFLYELTRHSDHHYKSTRKYQILRHMDESPQLPFGYPAGILLSLAPPLWFALMHPIIGRRG